MHKPRKDSGLLLHLPTILRYSKSRPAANKYSITDNST